MGTPFTKLIDSRCMDSPNMGILKMLDSLAKLKGRSAKKVFCMQIGDAVRKELILSFVENNFCTNFPAKTLFDFVANIAILQMFRLPFGSRNASFCMLDFH